MSGNGTTLVTMMYHYVRDVNNTPFPDIKGVSVDQFRRQVKLVRERFSTPPLEACLGFVRGEWDPGRDICILTFDDGLAEHHDTVAEILLSEGLPGVFFLPTAPLEDHEILAVHMNHFLLAYLGTGELRRHFGSAAANLDIELPHEPSLDEVRSVYRWDDDETARFKFLVNHQLPADLSERILAHVFPDVLGSPEEFARDLYIDWDQARSMQAAGLTIGGHTHRHKAMSGLDPDAQRNDLAHSMSLLRSNLGERPRCFAYPYGKPGTYDQYTIGHLEDLGYSCAFNTTSSNATAGTPLFEIPRIDPKDL
jgi:peptidoglycan/xylan/chitin deacetylase (PgdA/CDA1 family)